MKLINSFNLIIYSNQYLGLKKFHLFIFFSKSREDYNIVVCFSGDSAKHCQTGRPRTAGRVRHENFGNEQPKFETRYSHVGGLQSRTISVFFGSEDQRARLAELHKNHCNDDDQRTDSQEITRHQEQTV